MPQRVTEPFGGGAFAEAGEKAGRREYAGAAGSALAGVTEGLMWLVGAKGFGKPATKEALKAARTGKVTLPSGQAVKVTPGMTAGGKVAVFEEIVETTLGGARLAKAREASRESLQRAINEIVAAEGGEAMALIEAVPKNPALGARTVGRAMRHFSSQQYYQPVYEAMAAAEAPAPAFDRVVQVASSWSNSQRVKGMLTRNPEISAAVKETLVKLETAPITVKVAGTAGYASGFELAEGAIGNMKALARKPGLSNVDRAIIHDLTEELNTATLAAVSKTGGPELAATLQRARALTNQGHAMEDVGRALRGVFKGGEPSAIPGVSPMPLVIDVPRFERAILELSEMRPVLAGEVPSVSRLAQAFRDPARLASVREVSNLLARSTRAGQLKAAHFGYLGEIAAVGAAPGAVVGMGLGGPLGSVAGGIAGGAITLPAGAWLIARALTTKAGTNLVLAFLRSAPRSAAFTTLGQKIAQDVAAQETKQRQGQRTPVPQR